MTDKDFTGTPVCQLAAEDTGEVYSLSAGLPKCGDNALCAHGDSALSMTGTTAEDFGRITGKDKGNFYTAVRGNAFETGTHLLIRVKADLLKKVRVIHHR